jgi:DNA-binding HxlR family transcriptional regulator
VDAPQPLPMVTPLQRAAARVGDRWALLVIDALLAGPRRFNDLLEAVAGIAPNVLTQRLRHLEREGVVAPRPYSRRPPRVVYELTGAGHDLGAALRLLARWGAGEQGAGTSARCPTCGQPLEEEIVFL